MLRDCDKNGDGVVSKSEFHSFVTEQLGVKEVKPGDLNDLFETLDADSSGKLDLNELKAALKQLQDSAAAANDEEDTRAAMVAATVKAAKTAQLAAARESAAMLAEESAAASAALEAEIEADTAGAKERQPKLLSRSKSTGKAVPRSAGPIKGVV